LKLLVGKAFEYFENKILEILFVDILIYKVNVDWASSSETPVSLSMFSVDFTFQR
jgi:hypothetical protein